MNIKNLALAVCAGSILVAQPALATDEVLFWNSAHLQAIKTAGGAGAPPPKSSRGLAIQSIAAYDAANAIDRSHKAYSYNGIAPSGANRDAAIAQASYETLKALYPTQNFDSLLASRMALISDGAAKSDGIAVGSAAAASILGNRTADGSGNNINYGGSNAIGHWRPTPGGATNALLPLWGQVKPFAMTSGNQFRESSMPTLTSSEYTASYNEVKQLGALNSATRTADQTDIAKFWADGGGTVTPPGHWNRIAQTVATLRGQTTYENARMFALMNMAAADAAISCWDMKYTHDLWRPVTAIMEGDNDTNSDTVGDVDWRPLITTPSFPSFTSGHSTFSSAAAEVLRSFIGTDNFAFTEGTDFAGLNPRSYISFDQAVQEAGMSRIYGGIHFQFDNVIGQRCGTQVGAWTYNNYLQAVPEPSSYLVVGVGVAVILRRRRK